jgi:hypothetical protein
MVAKEGVLGEYRDDREDNRRKHNDDEGDLLTYFIYLPTFAPECLPQGLGKKWNRVFSRLHLHGLTFHSGTPVFVVAVGVVFLYAEIGVLISRPLGV